jgi:hypothetical protein
VDVEEIVIIITAIVKIKIKKVRKKRAAARFSFAIIS